MPLQTIEEDKLAVARHEPTLKYVSEAELKDTLKYCYMLVGIRGHNIPVDPEKTFLHNYIRANYGQHTCAEVRLAFDMAVQGKLGVEAKCFEDFSVLYFASIMNAFRKGWAREQNTRLQSKGAPEKLYTQAELQQIEDEYLDYLVNLAYREHLKSDKLPTTLKTLYQWRKGN